MAIGDKRRHYAPVVSSVVLSMIMSLALAPPEAVGAAPVGVVRPVFAGAAVRGQLPPEAADAVFADPAAATFDPEPSAWSWPACLASGARAWWCPSLRS